MPLTIPDFQGFKLERARAFLESFNSGPTRKGEAHFRRGSVQTLACKQPGCAYRATVLGEELYEVSIWYTTGWDAECSCDMLYGCKHMPQ
jgi:uncharacterized Zn finger protein